MTTTFENAIVGDRVWSIIDGWGIVTQVKEDGKYPIEVKLHRINKTFTFNGMNQIGQARTLFWDEIKIIAPEQPFRLPHYEVDTLLVVNESAFRYFSNFDEGACYCFAHGATSMTSRNEVTYWDTYRLPTDEEIKQKKVLP